MRMGCGFAAARDLEDNLGLVYMEDIGLQLQHPSRDPESPENQAALCKCLCEQLCVLSIVG